MPDARIEVADDENFSHIRLIGRTTFALSHSFSEYGMAVVERVNHISIDLSHCESMDSTIMGVMAKIGLAARQKGAVAQVVNADERLQKQLNSLGLTRILGFSHTESGDNEWVSLCQASVDSMPKGATQETILEAHETLMDIDPENIPKF